MEVLWHDLRYALRTLRKSPGFTAVAVLTLALGIGANTAIFSVVQNVLLRPLPYQDAGRLVQIWNTYFPVWPQLGLSPGDFQDWRRQSQSFSDIAAYVDVSRGANMTGEGEAERLAVTYGTSNLFPLLGIRAVAGRTFLSEEDRSGSAPEVLLSNGFWQSRFGANPAVVGRTLTLDGQGYAVVGILPANFHMAPWADLWMPVGQYPDDLTGRIHHPYSAIARLKPGVTLQQAQAELVSLNHQAEAAFPDTHKNFGVTAEGLEDRAAAKYRLALLLLLGAVGLVLLIACVNIANLLLARNAARQKEIALRVALGASQLRLVSQLLTESLLLSLLGGVLGIFLAGVGLRISSAFLPVDLASMKGIGLNAGVLGFTIAICFLTGIVCGAAPAAQTLKADLHGVLKEGMKMSAASGGQRLRSVLVVCEVALALLPLVGAGLLLRSLRQVLREDPGFRADHVLAMEVDQAAISPDELAKLTPEQQNDLTRKQTLKFQQMAEGMEGLPGVKLVGGIDVLPLASAIAQASRFVLEGRPIPAAAARPVAEIRTATRGYFGAMGIPLRRGRLFTDEDTLLSNIVINEAMARKFWPGSDPIGQRINVCSLAPQPCWFSIIGVSGDVHQYGLDGARTFDVYFTGGWTRYFVIRTAADPTSVARAATEEIHRIDPNLPITHVRTLDGLLADSMSSRRFSTVLLGIFAGLALVLSAVGIYGVMSYLVSLRTSEIGIRVALGAQPRDIWKLVLGRGVKLAVAGVVIGLAGAMALSRLLSSLLFEVRATDPVTFGGVAFLLMLVALAACYVPSRRAMRVDPMVALRYE